MWLARDYAHRTHRPDIAPDACGHDPALCPPIREENTEMTTTELCSDKNGFHDAHYWTPDPCDPHLWCPGYPAPAAG